MADYEKLFTVEEANATLPLVRAIASDMAILARDVVERRERLALLTKGRDLQEDSPYREELVQVEQELEKDAQRLQGYVDELTQLGVEPKNAIEGLLDFPSVMDGRVVYLCWKLDEPEVLHWHEIDAGFAGRQSLTAGSVSGEDLGGSEDPGPLDL
jgi:hypothetical protein